MKILYGIQGTGHGHISRAREIIPKLSERAEVDVILSGYNCQLSIDNVHIYKKRGISLAYDSGGSVSYLKTAFQIKPVTFIQDVHQLNVDHYNLIISDYEPVTAWASFHTGIPSIGLSHQASFLSNRSPRPKHKSLIAEKILKHFAPCNKPIGFHFQRYDKFIQPPIIREGVRKLTTEKKNHITVYLPAFDHESLVSVFTQFREKEWHIFSPLCEKAYQKENVFVNPVGNVPFLESMSKSSGVVTSAGFETCAEAMFLGKKLFVIPIRNQYEQLCNAAALGRMGVHVAIRLDGLFKSKLKSWMESDTVVQLNETADTNELSELIVRFASLYHRKKNMLFG